MRRTFSVPGAGIRETELVNPKRNVATPEGPDGDGTATLEFTDHAARAQVTAALESQERRTPAPAPHRQRPFTVGQAVVTVLLLIVIGLLVVTLIKSS